MIRVVALTEPGLVLGGRLQALLPGCDVWFKPQPFADKIQRAFSSGDRLILICATGIAVRTLAPVLRDKYHDPAVLVLDEAGRFVVPLLSGHQGGGNAWGAEVARLLSAQLVLTTAGDYLGAETATAVAISAQPAYAVGMGCERGCPQQHLQELLAHALDRAGLTGDDIASINSIDRKADEQGLIALAAAAGKPYLTWDSPTLAREEPLLSGRSDYVYQLFGVYAVAESAALCAARELGAGECGLNPELILPKVKTARATCAIARCGSPAENEDTV